MTPQEKLKVLEDMGKIPKSYNAGILQHFKAMKIHYIKTSLVNK